MEKVSYERALTLMKTNFPRWSDIRKRTKTSVGGGLLMAYAHEFDNIQKAIDAYIATFFLANYFKHEDKIVDTLYAAPIGIQARDLITVINPSCDITIDADDFFDHLSEKCFYEDGILLFHKSCINNLKQITYTFDKSTYTVDLTLRHIWNVFDEFALFAGIKRYEGETNVQLEERTLAMFKSSPNASTNGLKRAIQNAVCSVINVTEDEIEIKQLDKNVDYTKEIYKNIFEDFLLYNRDVFRAKVWDKDNWEHAFQTTKYLPHIWDSSMSITQNGVGYNNSLKVDYMSKIDASDYTDVVVSFYKKTERAIKEYIANTNIETSIDMTLQKYSDAVVPKKINYKITAHDVTEIDPLKITVKAMRSINGTSEFYLDDICQKLYGITRVERNNLEANQIYRLEFRPKSNYSSMEIAKCFLTSKDKKQDLRIAHGDYQFNDGVLVNKRILVHATEITDLSYAENIVSNAGFTVGLEKNFGILGVDITGMKDQFVTYKASCKEVDVTDTSNVKPYGNFTLLDDKKTYRDASKSSIGYILFKTSCNSFSFDFVAEDQLYKQGSITVTTSVAGKVTTITYTKPQKIFMQFNKNTPIEVRIQKNGQNPVTIKNFCMASYEIEPYLQSGQLVQTTMYTRLPSFTGQNTLYFKVIPHTSIFPVIEYVHIGASLAGACYTLDVDTSGLNSPTFNIDTNCIVQLLKKDENGKYIIVDKNYITKALFVNKTSENGYVTIDTEDFSKIMSSSPKIKEHYLGGTQKYITILPGQSFDKISISGEISKTIVSKPLSDYIFPQNITNWKAYVTKGANGIISYNTVTKETNLKKLTRTEISSRADTFRITGLSDGIVTRYNFSNGNTISTNDLQQERFETVFLEAESAQSYIAYNEAMMISAKKTVEIINTFSPYVNLTKLLFYRIEIPQKGTDKISFVNGNIWSLGNTPITIETDAIIDTAKIFTLHLAHINNKYILANDIPLEDKYLINDEYHSLKEYIITLSDDLKIDYEEEPVEETIVVSDTLVTKLSFSNVKDIVIKDKGSIISDYTLMDREGLVLWNNDANIGKTLTLSYTVLVPKTIQYKDWNTLYKLASYAVDAYERTGQITIKNLKDGDKSSLAFDGLYDKIVSRCTNAAFETNVLDNAIEVTQVATNDTLVIHNGYIYDDGLEYWHFSDIYRDKTDKFANVELDNVSKQNDRLLFHMHSVNYLPYSSMRTSVLSKMLSIDLTKRTSQSISSFNHLSACETLNLWYTVDIKVSLTNARNGYGVKFASKAGGYAVADITQYIKAGNIISLWATGDIKIGIVAEDKANGLPFSKSMFIYDKNVVPMKSAGEYFYYIVDKVKPETRYYIFVSGKDGILDDLISLTYTSLENMVSSHTKNIDRYNFLLEEKAESGYIYELEFDTCGAEYQDTWCSSDNILATTASMEYGLTRIKNFDLSTCKLSGVELKKDKLYYTLDDSKIQTRGFYVRAHRSIREIHIKINDIIADQYSGFNIVAYGSSTQNGQYKKIGSALNSNILTIPRRAITNYIYVDVLAAKGKIITSIEAYACYVETDSVNLTSITNSQGSFITKVYDIGTIGNYRFAGMNYETNNHDDKIAVYIRGLRENDTDYEFTKWKKYNKNATNMNSVIFNDYSLFQFKVDINDPDVQLKIHSFDMVVEDRA